MIAPHNINNPGWQGPGGTQGGWQPPRDLPGLSQLVKSHGHKPVWVHPDLHADLLAHYGSNGMVVAHPGAGGGAAGYNGPTEPTVIIGNGPSPGGGPGLTREHLGGIGSPPSGFTSPLGTNYTAGPSGTYINSSGYPRATAVNPADDQYGLSGATIAGVPPQPNPADFAMKGLMPTAKYY